MRYSSSTPRPFRWPHVLLLSGLMMAFAGSAHADQALVAHVKRLQGAVFVERDGQRQVLAQGDRLMRGDWIETSRAGAMGITFRDNTMVSVGPGTRILISEYAFAPADGDFAFVLEMARGTLVYISGVIAKLVPEAVEIRTPASTVAVRGTRFLAKVEPQT